MKQDEWLQADGFGGFASGAVSGTRTRGYHVDHLVSAGFGHASEIADAALPHTAGGCPFRAWSLGEMLRLDRVVLAHAAMLQPVHRTGLSDI